MTPDLQARAASDWPRVLQVITRNQRRGAESFAFDLSSRLADRDVDSSIVALCPAPHEPRLAVQALGRRAVSLATLHRLRRLCAQSTVVIAHGSRTLPATAIACAGLSLRLVYQNIGDPLYWAGSGSRRLRVRWLLSRMAAVAALTESSAHVLETRFGVDPSRLVVIRNARSGTTFAPASSRERANARERLAVPASRSLIACIGSLTPEKRLDVAIRAIGLLSADVGLVVVGDGPLRAELTDLAHRVAPGRVVFTGVVDDVVPALQASDALLLTSDSEGVPGVLIEAGLSGVPVVVTDVGYVRDVVVSGDTGLVVPVDDPGATAAAVLKVLHDRDRMSRRARETCLGNFELDSVVDAWEQLIQRVAGPPG